MNRETDGAQAAARGQQVALQAAEKRLHQAKLSDEEASDLRRVVDALAVPDAKG